MRRLERDAEAGAHRRLGAGHPLIPGFFYLFFARDVSDVDDRRQNAALVATRHCQALVDAFERLAGLLVKTRIAVRRYRDRKDKTVVNDSTAAGRRQAGETCDHGELLPGSVRPRHKVHNEKPGASAGFSDCILAECRHQCLTASFTASLKPPTAF